MVARAAEAQAYRQSIRPSNKEQVKATIKSLSLHCSAAATAVTSQRAGGGHQLDLKSRSLEEPGQS